MADEVIGVQITMTASGVTAQEIKDLETLEQVDESWGIIVDSLYRIGSKDALVTAHALLCAKVAELNVDKIIKNEGRDTLIGDGRQRFHAKADGSYAMSSNMRSRRRE